MRNSGNTIVNEIVVHVTGNSYPIGALDAGAQHRVRVQATSESHVELSLRGADGLIKQHSVDCYFEPRGYRGTILIELSDCHVLRAEDSVRVAYPDAG